MKTILIIICCFLGAACVKDNYPLEDIDLNKDYFNKKMVKPRSQWNTLDSLCDTIQKEFGIEIIYEYTPRIIDGKTFFMPPHYDKSLAYTQIMLKRMWLEPLKNNFPKFFLGERPIEFILAGGGIHFNSPSINAGAAGAGLNGQYYRLGMGDVNNFDKNNKGWLHNHLVILYHEHAHQLDHKYGRSETFDRVSQGKYYGLAGYNTKTEVQAQKDGFWRGYGGFAPEEDFATTVEHAVRVPEATMKRQLQESKSIELEKKYNIVHQKYLSMGVNLHQLQIIVDSVARRVNY